MSRPLRVLFVEDSDDDAILLARRLSQAGFDVYSERVESAANMRAALEAGGWDMVISDYVMPRFNGLDALELLQETGLDIPFIIISGTVGEDMAVDAVKRGAHDYIMKNNLIRLVPSVERELREAEVRRERRRSEKQLTILSQCLLNLGADPEENIGIIVAAGLEILDADAIKYWRMDGTDYYSLQFAFSRLEGFREKRMERMEREIMEKVFMWHRGPFPEGEAGAGAKWGADPDISLHGFESLMAHPVMLKGEILGCLCLFDRRKRDFSRQETDYAGMLAKAISIEEERWVDEVGLRDFIEIASHELRHPITIMKGYALTLKGIGGRLDDTTYAEALEAIDRGADRLGAILSDLLDTARIDRGGLSIARENVQLRALVDSALPGIQARYTDKVFDVRIDGVTGYIKVDPKRASQLLEVLLDNAAKFSPPGSLIELEAESQEEELRVSVMDRGEGIPGTERDRVFWRFYQVGDVKYHSIPGIGLGLYVARRIVEAHGGRIWYEPREGGGSAFHFTLPAR